MQETMGSPTYRERVAGYTDLWITGTRGEVKPSKAGVQAVNQIFEAPSAWLTPRKSFGSSDANIEGRCRCISDAQRPDSESSGQVASTTGFGDENVEDHIHELS